MAATTTSKPAKPKTKSATIIRLLSRQKGATLSEMGKATGWQPHSCRAFLTGLRKKGQVIVREARNEKDTAYRIVTTPIKSAESVNAQAQDAAAVEAAAA